MLVITIAPTAVTRDNPIIKAHAIRTEGDKAKRCEALQTVVIMTQ